jgi:hypothetical protein
LLNYNIIYIACFQVPSFPFAFFFFQHMGIAAGDDGHEVAAAVQYVIS